MIELELFITSINTEAFKERLIIGQEKKNLTLSLLHKRYSDLKKLDQFGIFLELDDLELQLTKKILTA